MTATGLQVLPFGGITVTVDGHEVKLPETMAYRALMLSGVPNFVFTIGYTNASWTLKADLVADYFCRLVGHVDGHGYRSFVADRDPTVTEVPLMDFTSGLRRPRARAPAEGRRPRAVEAAAELPLRRTHDPARARSRTARCASRADWAPRTLIHRLSDRTGRLEPRFPSSLAPGSPAKSVPTARRPVLGHAAPPRW